MTSRFLKFLKPSLQNPNKDYITVVSGLPRSGTSMMMNMLAAGGMEILTDNVRQADESNPKGYYEFERVKKLKEGDFTWLPAATGKAVKAISALLEYLPANYRYKVIFMRREMGEILASQRSMLSDKGEKGEITSDEKMAEIYGKHLSKVHAWLSQQANMEVIEINYNLVMREPGLQIERVNHFLDDRLDVGAMLAVVDRNLYRQRLDQ